MNNPSTPPNRRILVIDDTPAIHADFRKILNPALETKSDLVEFEAALYGDAKPASEPARFEVDSAFQGQEGLGAVQRAVTEGRPYAMAFVDVRMPPGWDGIETIERVWAVDPDLQIVICTAYSDYSWEEVTTKLGQSDRMVILKKPFDSIEVLQLANALTEKWRLGLEACNHLRSIEETVVRRTEALRESEEHYRSLFQGMLNGYAHCRMIFAEGKPQDFTYLAVNPAFETLTGLKDVVGKNVSAVIPGFHEADPQLLETYGRVALTGKPERLETYVNALAMWFAISVYSPRKDHFVVVFDVITERKRAEEELLWRTALLEAQVDSTPDGILVVDTRGKKILQNQRLVELFKVPRHVIEDNDDAKLLQHVLNQTVNPGQFAGRVAHLYSHPHEIGQDEFELTDGTVLDRYSAPVQDKSGKCYGRIWTFRDITQRKRADEMLKEQLELRERLAKISINAPGVIYAFRMRPDGSFCFPYSSPTIEKIYGVGPQELTNDASIAFERIHPEDLGRVRATIQESARTMMPWRDEFRVQHPEIGEIWVEGHSTPEKEPDGCILWHGFLQNITERKRGEEKLRLQTSALEAAASGIVITNREGLILWINPAFTRLTGYRAAEVVGKTPALLKSGKHAPEFYERIWKTILSSMVWQGEITNRRKDGSLYDEYMSITPVLDKKGKVQNFIAIKQDISEHKKFEQALAYERDLLRTLMENSSDMIYFKDLDSRFLVCSRTLAQRFGLSRTEDAIGKTDFDFFDNEHALPAFEDEKEIIRTGRGMIGKVEQEFWKGKNETTWALTNKLPLRNKEGQIIGTFGISKDITELKQAEQTRQMMEVQLRQSQKLEAIGQLAAGIAHEINTPIQYVGDNTRFLKDAFNNITGVLKDYAELLAAAKQNTVTPELLKQVGAAVAAGDLDYFSEQIPASISETLEGVERVAKIVRAMKEFSHPGGKEKKPSDLNKAIESTVAVARNEWKYVADMDLDLDPGLPLVPCFIGEFNQVILNLVINAAHAIGDVVKQNPDTKGNITLCTRRIADHVEVRVSDTGTGIGEAHQAHIFEPFFTTKEVGRGTGQGLSIVYSSIVNKHGGTVTFETEAGKGTTFIIRLPIAPKTTGIGTLKITPPLEPAFSTAQSKVIG